MNKWVEEELECIDFVEWQAVYIIAHKRKPPEKPPSIDSMNRIVASFGGFLNRKRSPTRY